MALHGPAVRNGEPNGVAVEGPGTSHEPWIHDPGASDASGQRRKAPEDEDHDMTIAGQRTVESIKREAKGISRATSITHSQALDVLAVQAGFSHWGAYQKAVESALREEAEWVCRNIDPVLLLRNTFPSLSQAEPGPGETRHLIISGSTSTGKTTLMSRIMDEVPAQVMKTVLEDHPDLNIRNANRIKVETGSGSDMQPDAIHWEHAYDFARTLRAGIAIFAEVSSVNAGAIVKAMLQPHGPSIVTTIHASNPKDAAALIRERARVTGPISLHPILCVQVARDVDGNRRVKEMVRL